MKCSYCNNELNTEQAFCPFCGQKIVHSDTRPNELNKYWKDVNRSAEIDKQKRDKDVNIIREQKRVNRRRAIGIFTIVIVILSSVFVSYTYLDKKYGGIKNIVTQGIDDLGVSDRIANLKKEIHGDYVSPTEYLFPSDEEQIKESDLEGLSKEEVGFIRNEIYARHGYNFQVEPYKSYFLQKSWYEPSDSFNENMLSSVEKYNIDIIVNYEKKMGWR